MARRWLGRSLLLLVVFLVIATLTAPLPAPALPRVGPPPLRLTPAPVSTAPAALCVRRPLLRCRRVRRLVASADGLRPRRWVWDHLVLSTAKPGAPALRCVVIHDPRYQEP